MSKSKISLIAASDLNNAIGYQNDLLCKIKEDMKRFVQITTGKPIIMGASTFESLGCKPLKNRMNIVLTHSPMALTIEHMDAIEEHGNLMFQDFEHTQYIINESDQPEFIVIGGQKIYELFLPFADKIYLTKILYQFEKADTYFPDLDSHDWDMIVKESHFVNEEPGEYPYCFCELKRWP